MNHHPANRSTTSPASVVMQRLVLAAVPAMLVLLAGCGGQIVDAGSSQGQAGADSLPADKQQACLDTVSEPASVEAKMRLTLVYDPTASEAKATMPSALQKAVVAASKSNGAIDVVLVDGRSTPIVYLKDRSITSDPGSFDPDLPSVQRTAELMPACLRWILDTLPAIGDTAKPNLKPGSDINAALQTAALITGNNESVAKRADANNTDGKKAAQLWVWTDGLASAGTGRLTKDLLLAEPAEAATKIAKTITTPPAAGMHLVGLGQTSQPLTAAQRSWLTDYYRALCKRWQCDQAGKITIDPVTATAAHPNAPLDPQLPWPGLTGTSTCTDQQVVWSMPGVLFKDNKPTLRDPDPAQLDQVIRLLKQNPSATARIVGHTAKVTRHDLPADGMKLSAERAATVKKLLIKSGITGSRITTQGVGHSQPKSHRLNDPTERRVDIIITGVQCR